MAELKKILFVLIIPLLLSSCLTIEAVLDLSEDLSGQLEYSASVSTLAVDLDEIDDDNSIIPFPLLEDGVRKSLDISIGVSLEEWNQSEDGTRYHVDAVLSFPALENLSLFSGISLESEQSGNNRILRVLVYQAGESSISETVIDIVEENFPNDYIQIKTEIPGSIVRVEGATFSGSTVTFRRSLSEILSSSEDIQFSVEYR